MTTNAGSAAGTGTGTESRAAPLEVLLGFLKSIRPALVLATVAFVVLALFAGNRFWHQSKAPHFVYQAMAFLQGHLELVTSPPNNEDWALVNGKWYSSFPAFPALVMVPFVAVNGYQFNDTSFTVILAALNLIAFFLVLRAFSQAKDSSRSERENLIFTALLCFGTLYFYCSIRGEVWFTAEVMGVGLTALYVLFAHKASKPALAGLFFSAAVLTRTPTLFSGVFFMCELFLPNGKFSDLSAKLSAEAKRERWIKLGQFVAGALPLALWHMWLNYERFGSISDFGHTHFFNNRVNADIQTWGLFHPHYLERNLRAAFFLFPSVQWNPFRLGYDPHGLSLLLTTPLFALAFFPLGGFKQRPRLYLALVLSFAAMALPGLFYQNDGYVQFGFRFSLDWTPYLLMLLAVNGLKMDKLFWSLAAVGVAVNTWGAIAFKGYSDLFS
jgi:hypothetical protein